jgi:hypothetical protein
MSKGNEAGRQKINQIPPQGDKKFGSKKGR